MAKLFCIEATGAYGVTPPTKAPGNVVGARIKRYRGVYVSTGANNAAGDTIVITRLPVGSIFAFGLLNASVSSGTTTFSIGNATTPAKHRALAAQTVVDTPVLFGKASAANDTALTAEEEVIATLAVGALPAGTYVFDIFASSPA